ncbi:hypothetical protein LIER_16254 [Lithospermum erythrorhizon]|uniref:Uncharacterized protein n=1 Tax=Lithospermum erythrorhizon TaxID=34254 RepID=A0AAV3Q600_LITER
MKEFNDCLDSIDVTEVTSHGCMYTWSPNWRNRVPSLRKLDYVFCNEEWGRVKACSEALQLVQNVIFSGQLSQENIILKRNLRSELVQVSKAELELLRKKARMNWLANGDFCISLFNRSILASKNKHQISLLMDDDGQIHTDPQIVEGKIVQFHEALFTSKGLLSDEHKSIIRDFLLWRVPAEACGALFM